MNYLIISGDFVKTGGMDKANHAFASYLSAHGHQVHLVAYRVEDDLLAHPNIFFHKVPKLLNSYFLSSWLLSWSGQYWAKRIASQGGRVIVNGGNCTGSDVNWVHYSPTIERGVRQPKKSMVDKFKNYFYCLAEHRSFAKAGIFIVNSKSTADNLEHILQIDPIRIKTIYYGIEPDKFCIPTPIEKNRLKEQFHLSGRFNVLFVGNPFDSRKGFQILWKVWQRLRQDPLWEGRLVLVGNGFQQWFEVNHLKDEHVKVFGFCNDIHKIIKACDLMVSPTLYEPYGLVIHESLCCGLPTVFSRCAGVSERFLDELDCLLINDPLDDNEIYQRIMSIKEKMDHYLPKFRTVSDRLRSYTWDNMSEDFIKIIKI